MEIVLVLGFMSKKLTVYWYNFGMLIKILYIYSVCKSFCIDNTKGVCFKTV